MKSDKISLSFKCSENFNEMPKTAAGRFCESCQHCVVDFTQTKNEELQQKAEGVYCGRFTIYQVENPFNNWKDYVVRFAQRTERVKIGFKPLKRVVFACGIISLFLVGASSCFMGVRAYPADADVYDYHSDDESDENPEKVKQEVEQEKE